MTNVLPSIYPKVMVLGTLVLFRNFRVGYHSGKDDTPYSVEHALSIEYAFVDEK